MAIKTTDMWINSLYLNLFDFIILDLSLNDGLFQETKNRLVFVIVRSDFQWFFFTFG